MGRASAGHGSSDRDPSRRAARRTTAYLRSTMPGRMLLDESRWLAAGYGRADLVRRRAVLRETLAALDTDDQRARYRALALHNLARWRAEAGAVHESSLEIRVLPGDWGDVTGQLTRERGVCF